MPDGDIGLRLPRVHPPARARRKGVLRPRLLEAFAGRGGEAPAPIVLITGPPGAGKSVLAQQWLLADEREHLEIPLTPSLDEPSALARLLLEGFERVGPDAGDLYGSINSTEPRLSTIVLPSLTRVAATRERDYILVVDDLHLLRNPGCHAVLRAVCDGTPAGSQVILISQFEAPPWLGRARAENLVEEVTAADLRFSVSEATELLGGMDVLRSRVNVDDVVWRTEGWAVGLYLTGLALRRGADSSSYFVPDMRGSSERFIRDYITTEVLVRLDLDLQSFVLRTSILNELEAGLCDAVLLRDDSLALLARLQEQLQLVIPLDAGGRRVRYHHLLSEALLLELSREAPAEVPILHARASRWYADRGLLDEAIRHAKAAGDLSEVGRLVWSGCGRSIASGDKDRLAFWLADLPEVEIAHDPWLTLAAAWLSLQSGRLDESARWILRAESHAGENWTLHAKDDPYAAELAVIVALVGHDGLRATITLIRAAAQGLPAESPYRAAALFILGVALTLKHDIESGRRALAEAERTARVLRVPIIQADALSWQGVLALAAGDLPSARRIIQGATGIVEKNRLERLTTSAHCITAQALLQALAHDPAARTTLAVARRLTIELDDAVTWFALCGRLIQARAAVSLGDGALARQLLTEARARMTPDLQDSLAKDLYEDTESALRLMRVDGLTPAALTTAELRVLQFLPGHLQLPQIGEHLFVSPNTVKTHVMAIHRKLGVSSRDEAVVRARELGLLEVPPLEP